MHPPLLPTSVPALRRALVASVLLHAVAVALALWVFRGERTHTELVDIEMAPPPPPVEALPEEVARKLDEQLAANAAKTDPASGVQEPAPPDEGYAVDAGVPDAPQDAASDAPLDAPPDARVRPDAAPDAAEPMVALADAGVDDAPADAEPMAAIGDAGVGADDAGAGSAAIAEVADAGAADATEVAMVGSGSGADNAGSGAGLGSSALATGMPGPATEAGQGSGSAGMTNEPAVDGAPTTAGTAANLLTYFPPGHIVTALIRFDRLRGTEWAAQTERLLRPMPDYQLLFGAADAKIGERLDTLVISTPTPRDATATTLVAHTKLGRAELRDFLGAAAPVTWSAARGGLLGTRTNRKLKHDKRVFLSPFRGWFLLAQPTDLGALITPATGNLDTVEAKGKLPAWLGSIRSIEAESGDPRGPALVVTLALGGERVDLGGDDFGLGVKAFPTPDRVSLAMELVTQGWLVRGNMRFLSEKDAKEFVAAAEAVKERVGDSRAIQMVLGKPLARVVDNLSFARTGGRVSYATSISIADARAILAVVAQQLDVYFAAKP